MLTASGFVEKMRKLLIYQPYDDGHTRREPPRWFLFIHTKQKHRNDILLNNIETHWRIDTGHLAKRNLKKENTHSESKAIKIGYAYAQLRRKWSYDGITGGV
jgi:hypothetical protein